ncbi:MAG TPA: hypothetical protein ENJ18_10560 [Nannocystis exedens]|nr:hypothetical protein [Nannocystis exedens]
MPTIATANVKLVAVSGGASASVSFTITGNSNRKIFVFNGSKDNTSTSDAPTSSITFDASGVNLTIGSGITRVGAAQLAQEGQYSSAGDLFEIKDADMGAARTVTIDIANLGSCQRQLWVIFEVYDASQASLDATAEHTDTIDVSSNTQHADSITSTADNCLLIGFWGLSLTGSSTGTWTTTLSALWDSSANNQSASYGDMAVVYTTKATAGAQALDFKHTTAISRHAGKLISIAPAASGSIISPGAATYQAYSGQSYNVAAETLILVSAANMAVLIGQTYRAIKERLITVGAGSYQTYMGLALNVIRATVISPATGAYQRYLGQVLSVSNGTLISVSAAVMASLVGQTYNLIKATVIQPGAAIYQRFVGTVPAVIKGGGSTAAEAARRLVNMASYLRRR